MASIKMLTCLLLCRILFVLWKHSQNTQSFALLAHLERSLAPCSNGF